MKSIKVIFEDSKYNYETSVNQELTDQQIKEYFIGQIFNLGRFKDNLQKCIECVVIVPQNDKLIELKEDLKDLKKKYSDFQKNATRFQQENDLGASILRQQNHQKKINSYNEKIILLERNIERLSAINQIKPMVSFKITKITDQIKNDGSLNLKDVFTGLINLKKTKILFVNNNGEESIFYIGDTCKLV